MKKRFWTTLAILMAVLAFAAGQVEAKTWKLSHVRPQDTAMFDGLGLQPGPITVTAKGLTVAFVGKPP